MRPVYVTVSGVGVSSPIPLNFVRAPFAVGIGCTITGTVTYSVQHTFDDITLPTFNPATATWFENFNISGFTVSADTNYMFPVMAIRLNITAGSGSVVMAVLQGTAT